MGFTVSRISRKGAKDAKALPEQCVFRWMHLNGGGPSGSALADRLGGAFMNSFIFRLF